LPLTEKTLIARISRQVKLSQANVRPAGKGDSLMAGIGDDCAVLRLPPGHEALVTTDFSLEGIHFRRDWHSPECVGHRCLARGLSDIAAMGGEPVATFLSLALPRKLPQAWVNRFVDGILNLAKRYGVTLAGGDTAESPNGLLADIVMLGSAPKGKAIPRSGAKPGDLIFVSGELGGSAAAVKCMQEKPKRRLNPRDYRRHFFPEPRLELGRVLRERGLASAMIDTSDGFSTDLEHICKASGVGAEINAELIPRAVVGRPARAVDSRLALHGGEDYELLFTASPGKRVPAQIAGVPLTQVGHITRDPHLFAMGKRNLGYELHPGGWEHFSR
jgi:thiamine-monophosphate kinase